jgi:predicted AlkP superfamily phosphohydrolase/phosphomutase
MAYQSWWPQMTAFALPSFYDGRIRLNLRDREAQGIVPIEAYEETCASIEAMLRQCQDPRTGQSAVANVERSSVTDPFLLDKSDADMTVVWQGSSNGFEHPEYGLIGPIPFRRTGGHTGPYGVAFIAAKGLPAGFRGVRSSFDVVPTIADLLKTQLSTSVSGTSLLTSLLS